MFFNLLMAKAKKKQQEYIELEYLESTGTQWIDTGLKFQPLKAVINLCFVESNTRELMGFGSYRTTYFGKTTAGLFELGGSFTLQNSNAYEWQEVTFTHNGLVIGGSGHFITKFGEITRTDNITDNIQGSSFYLFNVYNAGTTYACRVKISSAKFYNPDTNKLIMDLIPVLDKNLEPCMYDKVSGKYFYNEGTGEFKWKLPNQLEYLESDGNQYLLTDYYPNSNTAVEVDYFPNPSSTFTVIYGSLENSNANKFHTVISSTNYCLQINSHNGSSYYGLDGNGYFLKGGQEFIKEQIRVVLTVDNYNKVVRTLAKGQIVNYDMTTTDGLGEVNCVHPLVIFNRMNGGVVSTTNGYKGRIYSFKIWESDKLLHYYIPVYDKALTPCMYDLVSKKYFYNNGTGQFKGCFEDGSQVVSYLSATGTQWIDTGLIANQLIDKTLYIKMKNTGNSGNYAYNGAYDISGTGLTIQFGLFATSDTQCRTTQNYFDPSYSQTTGLDKSLFYELQMDKTTYWLNGEVVGTHTQTDEEKIKTCVNPFLIFGRSQKNAGNSITPMAISRFWIKNADGSYLQNLVPVLKSDNTACMLDLITKQYFVNKGTGSFTYGTQVNLFDPTKPSYVAGYISTNNNGNITSSTLTDTFYIPCKPNTTYLIKRTAYKEYNQVWRAATTPTVPTVNMSTPHFTGGLINDLYLVIKSRDVDKYLLFSEGRTLHTDDLSKFTVLEIEDNNSLIA